MHECKMVNVDSGIWVADVLDQVRMFKGVDMEKLNLKAGDGRNSLFPEYNED